jgi:hypothetical protein
VTSLGAAAARDGLTRIGRVAPKRSQGGATEVRVRECIRGSNGVRTGGNNAGTELL